LLSSAFGVFVMVFSFDSKHFYSLILGSTMR
jgi:hypothetical protein